MLPTPPAAPVTTTSPLSGLQPCSSSAMTLSMAVKPAVPIAIAPGARALGQRHQPVGLDPREPGEPAPVPLAHAPAGEHHLVRPR